MALMAIVVPILPGKTAQWRRFADELRGPRHADYAASRRHLGVRERAFFQSTPQGDLVIVTLEGDDPVGAFQRFAASNDEFTRWFVQQVKEIHDFDLTQPPPGPMPELAIDSHAGARV
ncbi:MAG: hypothetical protein HY690_10470 [Chloroflexi bacterium]|nr:hypothetical protein [Chloroflexota bacterium]